MNTEILTGLIEAYEDELKLTETDQNQTPKQMAKNKSRLLKSIADTKSKLEKLNNNDEQNYDELRTEFEKIILKLDLYYVMNLDRWVLWGEDGKSQFVTTKALNTYFNGLRRADVYDVFDGLIVDLDRKKTSSVCTFREILPDQLNMLKTDFCLIPDTAEDPHWFFDLVLTSIGARVPENIDHIEKLILAKYFNPANYLLPALVVWGHNGSIGKSLFASKLLTTVFGKNSVADNVAMNDVTRQFNSHVIGKTVVFINESIEDKVDVNRLNQTLQSETLWLEPKGVDKVPADNTALYMISGNGVTGAVKVSGNDTDRRFSIIRAEQPLRELVAEMLTHLAGETVTEKEAKSWIETEGQFILADKEQCGKWLKSLVDKHGKITELSALRNKDYDDMVEMQKPFHVRVFEQILLDDQFSYIKQGTLYEFYKYANNRWNSGGYNLARNTFYSHLAGWIKREKIPLEMKKRLWLVDQKTTSADVVYNTNYITKAKLTDNDDEYFDEVDGNRKTWLVGM